MSDVNQRGISVANVTPVPQEQLPEFADYFEHLEHTAGYVPNSFLTMARHPKLLRGYMTFSAAVAALDSVDPELKILMSHLASSSFGCRFCEAHTANTAVRAGVSEEKIAKVWEFEHSDLFSAAERSALRLARDAGRVPNETTPEHFDELRNFFTDDQIVEMVTAICLFGFWNRWNDTMATDLEAPVLSLATALLTPRGWSPGRHQVNQTQPTR
jgi:alkylhydroperoxidase family enzyme